MMRMRSSQGRVSLSALILCFRAEKMTFTGPNSICCVDRNVEKKNREQRLKNPVHRAPLSIVRGSQPQTKNQRANRVRPAIRDQRLMESMIQATLVAAKIGLIEDGGHGEK